MEVKFLLLTIVCVKLLRVKGACDASVEQRIIDSKFCNYDKFSQPNSNKTEIYLVFIPVLIEYLDTSATMKLTTWMTLSWNDSRISWDRKLYNRRYIDIQSNMIWTPDLMLLNWLDESPVMENFDRVVVSYIGRITTFTKITMKGYCVPNFTNWPFDENTCELVFISKQYTGNKMDYVLLRNGMILHAYKHNPEWELLDYSARRNITVYNHSDPNETFYNVGITLTFKIKRRASVLVFSYVTPAFALVVLSAAVFWLNPDSSQRIFVICMIVLLQCLYTSYLAFKIHSNGKNIPKIVRFYSGSLILSTILFVLTVTTRCMTRWSSKPSWLQTLSNIILTNRIVQLVLLTHGDLKATGDYESLSLVSKEDGGRQWRMLAKIINKAGFILILPVYIFLFIHFIT